MDIFENVKNKKIRVFQKDGFTKHGTLYSYNDTFIVLRFEDGTVHSIAIDTISNWEVDG